MPAPKLTRIIDAVAARLADIQVANGYYTDMGLRVILDFRAPQSEELPAVSVFLGERAAESNLGCDARVEMLINVIGYVAKDGGQAYLLGDEILADIQRAMSGVKHRVQACYDRHKVPGLVMLKIKVGRDGRVAKSGVEGVFSGTPTGNCVKKAVDRARFPRFSGPPMTFSYPFSLR